MWDTQDNNECWNYSRGTTSGQDSKKMSRNIYKSVLGVNRTKSSTRRSWENDIHWKFHRDHGRKSALI